MTIGWALECAEKGLLQEEGLRFGNAEKLLSLLEQLGAEMEALVI